MLQGKSIKAIEKAPVSIAAKITGNKDFTAKATTTAVAAVATVTKAPVKATTKAPVKATTKAPTTTSPTTYAPTKISPMQTSMARNLNADGSLKLKVTLSGDLATVPDLKVFKADFSRDISKALGIANARVDVTAVTAGTLF